MHVALPTSWWEWLIVVFGAYRLTRLAGWDDWPPVVRIRAWVIGERWVSDDPILNDLLEAMRKPVDDPGRPVEALTSEFSSESKFVASRPVPGKPPSSEVEAVRPAYDRPTLAHLIHCPFCLGFWVSLAVYGFWLLDARWALYTLFPWALSGLVGLISKNLDP
jgi:hypothetical protein